MFDRRVEQGASTPSDGQAELRLGLEFVVNADSETPEAGLAGPASRSAGDRGQTFQFTAATATAPGNGSGCA